MDTYLNDYEETINLLLLDFDGQKSRVRNLAVTQELREAMIELD